MLSRAGSARKPVRVLLAAAAATLASTASAQTAPDGPKGVIHLTAGLTADGQPLRTGLVWRVFALTPDASGERALLAQSTDPQPTFTLPEGTCMVHAAYGFASAMREETVASGRPGRDNLVLNAGALNIRGLLGDAPVTPDKLSLSIYVPKAGDSEAKLVVANAKPNQPIGLPEGLYHIKSTFLDTVGVGSLTPVTDTNSVVSADLRVQAGKLVEATVRHRAAVLTLKLVKTAGGEALANTSFTILTPGGDVIRELIGAFPSLVLAEGDYLVIARHDGRTYQGEFKVESNRDRDVEVMTTAGP